MTTEPQSELDALVAAANESIQPMDRCADVAQASPPSSIGPPLDLLELIEQADRNLSPDFTAPPKAARPSSDRRPADAHAAPGSRLEASPTDLQGLIEQASDSAAPLALATSPDVAWASALGQPEAKAPVAIAEAIDQAVRETVDGESPSPGHRTHDHERSRWNNPASLLMLTFLLIVALGFLAHHYWDGPPPLAEDQPTFAISTTQQQLVPLLINARNKVEAYRKQHGVLPDQIDLNIAGVDFFLSPESKSYVIMAVTEGQNLAITQEGHWFWAQ
ncbi:MAG: hypothetical protein KDJ22_11640 [Candidatus Competibacteraceae bacterium]|nr:hypothetical protein [Candidatus Competibacteraceae bacterium]MCP5124452.1 hypothetical protein [Gammaproteobacteria bacterium]HRX71557.1 hypothetical protein [Candidatus Competibacteraceae bacterium]